MISPDTAHFRWPSTQWDLSFDRFTTMNMTVGYAPGAGSHRGEPHRTTPHLGYQ